MQSIRNKEHLMEVEFTGRELFGIWMALCEGKHFTVTNKLKLKIYKELEDFVGKEELARMKNEYLF